MMQEGRRFFVSRMRKNGSVDHFVLQRYGLSNELFCVATMLYARQSLHEMAAVNNSNLTISESMRPERRRK